MKYGILLEPVADADFPPGYYYAHIPSLGLTTHGLGIEGAKSAAHDLAQVWISEKRSHNEIIQEPGEIIFATLDLAEDAV